MPVEFRNACEHGFRSGAISVLVATSTVATGINLPAQRVIVRDLFLGQRGNLLDSSRMRQMAGRAGRSGIDSKGEAVFIVGRREPPSRLQHTMKLLAAPVRHLHSQVGGAWHAAGCVPLHCRVAISRSCLWDVSSVCSLQSIHCVLLPSGPSEEF